VLAARPPWRGAAPAAPVAIRRRDGLAAAPTGATRAHAPRRRHAASAIPRAGSARAPATSRGDRDLPRAGGRRRESASLYWNWAQAAARRGNVGEALWALLRARELDPGDRAVARDIERLRESASLDRASWRPIRSPRCGACRGASGWT
jgi:hypothetical protein